MMWGSSPTFFFREPMVLDAAFLQLIREHVERLGFDLADLRRTGTLERPILQLRVDRPDSRPGYGVTAEDCAAISRSLERFLESEGLVGPRYVLEVSSPGIDRPLRWPEHWRRYVGHRARVRASGIAGRPTVEILAVPDDDHVTVRLPDGAEKTLALDQIREAHLAVDWEAELRQRGGHSGEHGGPKRQH
jgi:ribosome maturation factor RimP